VPSDRQIDGRDLRPLLTNASAPSPHECIFHWKGAPGLGCPADHPACPGLWAVRCGPYKLHWVTMDTIGPTAFKPAFQTPPLLFHLEHDPSEAYPINASTAEYASARATIEAAADAHRQSVTPVPNQAGLGQNKTVKVCCDWESKSKYPTLPTCSCNVSNFQAWVCEPVWETDAVQQRRADAVAVSPEGSVARPLDLADESTWPQWPLVMHPDA
jgi:arylsulfatase A